MRERRAVKTNVVIPGRARLRVTPHHIRNACSAGKYGSFNASATAL